MKVKFKLDSGRVGSVDVANVEELQLKLEEVQRKTGQGVTLENSVSVGQSLQRGAGQGITFGFADELAGMLKGLPGSDRYKAARDEARLKNHIAEQANKVSYNAADIGAGMLIPGAGVGGTALKAGNKARKLTNLGRYATAGAASGTASGLGYSDRETAGELAVDAGIGGVGGALFGAGAGWAGEESSRLLGKLGRGVHRASVEDPAREGAAWVRSMLPPNAKSPQTTRQALKDAGADSRLINLDEGTLHAGQVAKAGGGPESSRRISDNLVPQRDAAVSRLSNDVHQALPDVQRTPEDMLRRWKNDPVADSNYKLAYQDTYRPSPAIQLQFATNRALQDAMEDAAESMRGKPIANMQPGDFNELPNEVPVEYMHRLLRYVRGKKDKLYRSNDSARGSDLAQIFRDVDADVKRQSPNFAAAQSYYRDRKAMEDALQLGQDIFKGKRMPEELDYLMEGFSKSEEAAFRVGMMRALLVRVGDITEAGNTGNKILTNNRIKELVQRGIDDPHKFTALLTRVQQEQPKARAANRLLNNSVTLEGMGADKSSPGLQEGNILSAIKNLFGRVMNQEMTPEAWQEAAELLTGDLTDEQLNRIFYRPMQQKLSQAPLVFGTAASTAAAGQPGRRPESVRGY